MRTLKKILVLFMISFIGKIVFEATHNNFVVAYGAGVIAAVYTMAKDIFNF